MSQTELIQIAPLRSIQQVQAVYLDQRSVQAAKKAETKATGPSFEEVLQTAVAKPQVTRDGLKFSKHAAARLAQREIALTREQMQRLGEGARKAGEKGIKDSLVMVDNLAFIVSVPNATVVTAIDQNQTAENIFTNIDGAVIA